MLWLVDDLDDLLKRARSVHVFAQLNRVLFASLDDFCQSGVVSDFDQALYHVVAEWIHHQVKELANRLVEHEFDDLRVFLQNDFLEEAAAALVAGQDARVLQELQQTFTRQ